MARKINYKKSSSVQKKNNIFAKSKFKILTK